MRIDGAILEGGNIVLQTSDPATRRFFFSFEPGEYEITKVKKRRSLDANAYAWVLIHKISDVLHRESTEVYRDHIREVGGASETVCVKDSAAETLVKIWQQRGLGWQAETFPSKLNGCTNVILHYGSSAFDTRQMSQLIDNLVQDAKALGIETMTERELSLVKEGWGA